MTSTTAQTENKDAKLNANALLATYAKEVVTTINKLEITAKNIDEKDVLIAKNTARFFFFYIYFFYYHIYIVFIIFYIVFLSNSLLTD